MDYKLLVSALALLLSVYTFIKRSAKEDTTQMTTVIVKLENISSGITDIKAEIANMKVDQKEDHDRLIRVESSLSEAWARIESGEKK